MKRNREINSANGTGGAVRGEPTSAPVCKVATTMSCEEEAIAEGSRLVIIKIQKPAGKTVNLELSEHLNERIINQN